MINQVSFKDSHQRWDAVFQKNSLRAPFFTWEWHNIWYRDLSENYEEFTLLIDDTLIAPFAKNGDTVLFSGGDEIADYLDIIGQNELKLNAWKQIIPYLQSHGVSKLKLRNIPGDSQTVDFFKKTSTGVQQEDTTPCIVLPNSWDAYKESLDKKYRHELERKIRKFERENIDAQIHESNHPEDDLHILFDLMEKDDSKKRFLTPQMKNFFTHIALTFSDSVLLRYISLGNKKISCIMGFIQETSFYLYNSGFDKDCCNSAGFFLKAVNIKHAIERKMTVYNFLQGNERYKYELGGKDFFVYAATLQI